MLDGKPAEPPAPAKPSDLMLVMAKWRIAQAEQDIQARQRPSRRSLKP